jgi:phosphotransferase system HPr (HPr) family protein
MIVKEVVIKNMSGLHARPSAQVVKTANKFDSDIVFEDSCGSKCDAKSIMGIMSLVLNSGIKVKIYADGKDEKEAVEAVVALLKNEL